MTAANIHSLRLRAARLLLARWALRGAGHVVLRDGRIEPVVVEPGPEAMAAGSEEAAQALAASVAMGEKYNGWNWAMDKAGETR